MAQDSKPFSNDLKESDINRRRVLSWLVSDQELAGAGNSDDLRQTECWDSDWSSDGQFFAWSCGQRIVKIVPTSSFTNHIELNGFQPGLVSIDCRQIVTSLAFASCYAALTKLCQPSQLCYYRSFHWEKFDQILAVGLRNGRIRIFDVYTGRVLLELIDHDDCITRLDFAPDDSLVLLSSSSDGTIKFWDLTDDGNMTETVRVAKYTNTPNVKHRVCSTAWSPDARRIAAVGTFKSVLVFDAKDYNSLPKKFQGHTNTVNSCDFSADGVLLATCSQDTVTIVWNSFTGDPICKLGHQFPPPSLWFPKDTDTVVRSCRFSKNSDFVITVSSDDYVRFWDLDQSTNPAYICKINHPTSLCIKKNSSLIAVGTNIGSVGLLESPTKCLTLSQICRIKLNSCLTSNNIMSKVCQLPLPYELEDFLQYQIIKL